MGNFELTLEESSQAIRNALQQLENIDPYHVSVVETGDGTYTAEFTPTTLHQSTIGKLVDTYSLKVSGTTYKVELIQFESGSGELVFEVSKEV